MQQRLRYPVSLNNRICFMDKFIQGGEISVLVLLFFFSKRKQNQKLNEDISGKPVTFKKNKNANTSHMCDNQREICFTFMQGHRISRRH